MCVCVRAHMLQPGLVWVRVGVTVDRGVLIHAWTERHASPASLLPITGLFNLINVQLAGRKTNCAPTPGQGGGERGSGGKQTGGLNLIYDSGTTCSPARSESTRRAFKQTKAHRLISSMLAEIKRSASHLNVIELLL